MAFLGESDVSIVIWQYVETKGILKIDIHMLEHQMIICNSVKIGARMVPNVSEAKKVSSSAFCVKCR